MGRKVLIIMAWKRDWHVEVTCEKCGTKKEAYVTCRQDEVGHYTWRLSYCDKCEEWMKAEEIVTAIPKSRPTPRAVDGGQAGDENGQVA